MKREPECFRVTWNRNSIAIVGGATSLQYLVTLSTNTIINLKEKNSTSKIPPSLLGHATPSQSFVF
jgi:hypothetical protein